MCWVTPDSDPKGAIKVPLLPGRKVSATELQFVSERGYFISFAVNLLHILLDQCNICFADPCLEVHVN